MVTVVTHMVRHCNNGFCTGCKVSYQHAVKHPWEAQYSAIYAKHPIITLQKCKEVQELLCYSGTSLSRLPILVLRTLSAIAV